MPSIKIISDVALYSSLTALSGITTPSLNITQSFTSPEITALGNASGTWDETYTTVRDNSASWLDGGKDAEVRGLTANWDSTTTSVSTNSSNWNEAYTSVSTTSSNWNESYTWVNTNSSTLDVSKIDIGNSHLADDETVKLSVNGNVVIYGDLSATGNTTLVNVTANVTDSLSVVNPGFGVNALTIEQYGPLPAIHASHYGTGPLLILSGQGNVGIGTDEPNSKLTVVGTISTDTPAGYTSELTNTSDVWYKTSVSLNSNSGNWESTYSTVSSNSASWGYDGSDLRALTANYDSTYTTFRDNSAYFLTSYIESQNLSFNQNTKELTLLGGVTPSTVSLAGIGGGSDVSGLSGNWEGTYTIVKNNSASWAGGSAISGVSGKWEDSSNVVQTNSAKWSNAYTTLNSKSATWDTAAAGAGADAAVRALTGKWEDTSTAVRTNSSNWNDTYTTVKNNSSSWVDQDIITSGTYGSSTAVPRFVINTAGKITSVSEQTITPAGINAAPATHTHTISQISDVHADVKAAVLLQSNIANAIAIVGSNGKLPANVLPAGVDAIQEYANRAAFPATGTASVIYLAQDANKVYRWGSTQYTEIVASPGTTDNVTQGYINKYYSAALVQQDAPVKSVNSKTGIITLTYADVSATHMHIATDISDFATATNTQIQAAKSTNTPAMNGTAAVGTGTTWARADHVHPTDTSRAPLASPTFTGTVTIPTLNVTTIQGDAVTNAVQAAAAITASPASDGGAASIGTGTTWARADHKHASDGTKANLNGATFTGTVVVPTLTVNTSIGGNGFTASTSAVVVSLSGTNNPAMNGTAAVGISNKWSPQDHVHPTDTSRAPLASPTFTGTLKSPTVSATTLYGNLLPGITTQTSSFTLAASDAGTIIKCNHASTAIVITVPYQASDTIPPGTQIILVRTGNADVSVSPQDGGVYIYSVEKKRALSSDKSLATLIYTGTNEWLFAGDIN